MSFPAHSQMLKDILLVAKYSIRDLREFDRIVRRSRLLHFAEHGDPRGGWAVTCRNSIEASAPWEVWWRRRKRTSNPEDNRHPNRHVPFKVTMEEPVTRVTCEKPDPSCPTLRYQNRVFERWNSTRTLRARHCQCFVPSRYFHNVEFVAVQVEGMRDLRDRRCTCDEKYNILDLLATF